MNYNILFSCEYGQDGAVFKPHDSAKDYYYFELHLSIPGKAHLVDISLLIFTVPRQVQKILHPVSYGTNYYFVGDLNGTPVFTYNPSQLAAKPVTEFIRDCLSNIKVSSLDELRLKVFHLFRFINFPNVDDHHMLFYEYPLDRSRSVKVASWEVTRVVLNENEEIADLRTFAWNEQNETLRLDLLIHLDNKDSIDAKVCFCSSAYFKSIYSQSDNIHISTPYHVVNSYAFEHLQKFFAMVFNPLTASDTREAMLKLGLYFDIAGLDDILATPFGTQCYSMGEVAYRQKDDHF